MSSRAYHRHIRTPVCVCRLNTAVCECNVVTLFINGDSSRVCAGAISLLLECMSGHRSIIMFFFCPAATIMSDPGTQCWFGSIPAGLSEQQILHELAAYNVRPWKLVVRNGTGSSQATAQAVAPLTYYRRMTCNCVLYQI